MSATRSSWLFVALLPLLMGAAPFRLGSDCTGRSSGPGALSRPEPLVFDSVPVKISSLHQAATVLRGHCSEVGGDIVLSGPVGATTPCAADGTWSVTMDFSTVADGVVALSGVQWTNPRGLASVPVVHDLVKDAAFCDDPAHASATPFAAGSGTPADPYVACNGDQLTQLAGSLGASVQLMNDLDVGAAPWTPIGDFANPFTGTLDGNGHVIENLQYPQGIDYSGVFAYASGTITDLGVLNVNMVGGCHIGALVGVLNVGGVVQRCYSSGVIHSTSDSVGGLVGWNDGTISNSHSSVEVSDVGYNNIGGLAGYSSGLVSQSFATGTVTAQTSYDVGGLLGHNDGRVENAHAWGAVSGDASSYNLGGLVGSNPGQVSNSYSIGAVTIQGSGCVGGLVGAGSPGTVMASYWNLETSGQPASVGGDGLGCADMQLQSSYLGWDFTTVWTLQPMVSAYPVLR